MARLVISPSQQPANQYSGGGTGYADSEQRWMEELARKVKTRFDAQGWGIPCSIVEKGGVKANVAESNRLKATEHVALHTNAGGGHGTLVIHYPGSVKGRKLAVALFNEIAKASDRPDIGVRDDDGYYELKRTLAPAVIVEYAFHDNPSEANEIRKSLDEYAEATVRGLAAYYGKPYKAPAGTRYFIVQVHTSEYELPAYLQFAKQHGDAVKVTGTSKTSYKDW